MRSAERGSAFSTRLVGADKESLNHNPRDRFCWSIRKREVKRGRKRPQFDGESWICDGAYKINISPISKSFRSGQTGTKRKREEATSVRATLREVGVVSQPRNVQLVVNGRCRGWEGPYIHLHRWKSGRTLCARPSAVWGRESFSACKQPCVLTVLRVFVLVNSCAHTVEILLWVNT